LWKIKTAYIAYISTPCGYSRQISTEFIHSLLLVFQKGMVPFGGCKQPEHRPLSTRGAPSALPIFYIVGNDISYYINNGLTE
jgi:hypothetical protein